MSTFDTLIRNIIQQQFKFRTAFISNAPFTKSLSTMQRWLRNTNISAVDRVIHNVQPTFKRRLQLQLKAKITIQYMSIYHLP